MRRGVILVLFTVLGSTAVAFGCTNISTLNISDSSGRPGDRIQVTGSSFGNSSPTGRRTSTPLPVRIHWNGTEGGALAEVAPDGAGNISASITIPDVSPGHYVILAVQQDTDGYHMYGTPARIAFEVLTPDGRSVPRPGALAEELPTGSSQSWKVPAALAVLGVAGGVLFAAGFSVFVRTLSPRDAARPSPVRSDK